MKSAKVEIGRALMCALREAVTGRRWLLTEQLAPKAPAEIRKATAPFKEIARADIGHESV